jgi:eukaryotic-like serine/threonine-protein kinase
VLRDLGPYRLFHRFGRGGVAEIFLAVHREKPGIFVVKLLKEPAAAQEASRARFHREAKICSTLDHRSIARLLDAGAHEGTEYLVFELVAGQTLRALIQKGTPIPMRIALGIAVPLLDALHFAHSLGLGIVHRDLSPNNLMISYEGVPKIIDFGIAAARVDDFLTMPGQRMGTLRYLSTEQALGLTVDLRSDLYSFGLVLWEMLSGRPVVSTTDRNVILAAVLESDPGRLPGHPEDVAAVVLRALAKDREARWSNALEMKEALVRAAGQEIAGARELARFVRSRFEKERAELAALCAPYLPPEQRDRVLLSAAAGALIAALVFGLYFWPSSRPRSVEVPVVEAPAVEVRAEPVLTPGPRVKAREVAPSPLPDPVRDPLPDPVPDQRPPPVHRAPSRSVVEDPARSAPAKPSPLAGLKAELARAGGFDPAVHQRVLSLAKLVEPRARREEIERVANDAFRGNDADVLLRAIELLERAASGRTSGAPNDPKDPQK